MKKNVTAVTCVSLLLLNASIVLAQQPLSKEDILSGQAPSSNVTVDDVMKAEKASQEPEKIQAREFTKRRSLRLKGIISSDAYDVSAGGRSGARWIGAPFNGALSENKGFGYGAEYRMNFSDSAFGLNAKYNSWKTSYSGISTSSPASFSVSQVQYMLGATWLPNSTSDLYTYDLLRGLKITLGYQYNTRTPSENTSRDTIVNKVKNHGVVAKVSDEIDINKMFYTEFGFEVFRAVKYTEMERKSGSFKNSTSIEGSASLAYRLGSKFDVALGLFYRKTFTNFAGSGDRGTSNSDRTSVENMSERNFSYGVPVEIRYNF